MPLLTSPTPNRCVCWQTWGITCTLSGSSRQPSALPACSLACSKVLYLLYVSLHSLEREVESSNRPRRQTETEGFGYTVVLGLRIWLTQLWELASPEIELTYSFTSQIRKVRPAGWKLRQDFCVKALFYFWNCDRAQHEIWPLNKCLSVPCLTVVYRFTVEQQISEHIHLVSLNLGACRLGVTLFCVAVLRQDFFLKPSVVCIRPTFVMDTCLTWKAGWWPLITKSIDIFMAVSGPGFDQTAEYWGLALLSGKRLPHAILSLISRNLLKSVHSWCFSLSWFIVVPLSFLYHFISLKETCIYLFHHLLLEKKLICYSSCKCLS